MYIIRIIFLSRVFVDDSKTLNRHHTGPSSLLIKYVRTKTSEASAFVESLMPRNLCTLPAPREIVNFLLPIVRPGPSPYMIYRSAYYILCTRSTPELGGWSRILQHYNILNHILPIFCICCNTDARTCVCVRVCVSMCVCDFRLSILPRFRNSLTSYWTFILKSNRECSLFQNSIIQNVFNKCNYTYIPPNAVQMQIRQLFIEGSTTEVRVFISLNQTFSLICAVQLYIECIF